MRIERRFCGPSDSGNGGYSAGCLASWIEGPAEVTLRAPPPLDIELTLERRGDGGVALLHGEQLIAEAKPTELELELPGPVSWEAAQAASRKYIGFHAHPYPGCFVCGPQREPESGAGLALFPGATQSSSGRPVAAAPFEPAQDLGDAAGLLRPEFVWSALDCPSWFGHASYLEPPLPKILLGRLAARILRRPAVGERCVAVGWSMGQEGRRITCGSALYDTTGDCLAFGKAVWVEVKSA